MKVKVNIMYTRCSLVPEAVTVIVSEESLARDTHAHAHAHARTHTRAHARTHARTDTHARTHTHAHSHKRTHARTDVRRGIIFYFRVALHFENKKTNGTPQWITHFFLHEGMISCVDTVTDAEIYVLFVLGSK